ncbi:MAG: VCBS repeat-containing protein [Planctomycetaceae bacterium]|nr:VCBS repeat-containing protein [Planctomycetaceae bacterium]
MCRSRKSLRLSLTATLLLAASVDILPAADSNQRQKHPAEQSVVFQRLQLTDRYYCDGVTAADIDQDGHVDVVAGPFWYAGPEFRSAHEFYEAVPLPPEKSPSNSMFSFVHDFSGDGRPDILVLGRVHLHSAVWYENPGTADQLWTPHFVFERVRGESPLLTDLDQNGQPELLCHWDGCWGLLRPVPEHPYQPWTFTAIGENEDWPQFYHGEGVGDVNHDGRPDIILNDGWYEQPEQMSDDQFWPFHRHLFSADRGGAQMLIDDVDQDGDADIISALNAHGWGLAWFEQQTTDDRVSFQEHLIMSDHDREAEFGAAFTQPHALALADIDGDGRQDIITGKRMWAHGPAGDIEPDADPVVYWFQQTRNEQGDLRYVPHLIDRQSGVGVQIAIVDVNQDQRPDVLTASKLGVFVFLNHNSSTTEVSLNR